MEESNMHEIPAVDSERTHQDSTAKIPGFASASGGTFNNVHIEQAPVTSPTVSAASIYHSTSPGVHPNLNLAQSSTSIGSPSEAMIGIGPHQAELMMAPRKISGPTDKTGQSGFGSSTEPV
ncbi:unnamed protein product [Protopolystoma xenopodis]|uniref:Uncharacterized protein n=1 Tax=Protopolystoma xenopodis TaxID=117903 RepID=A0A3S5BTC2_9PLAT|nr:unnamed protein product [Protopolystoma xenopodis]